MSKVSDKTKGYIAGLLSAMTFGLIPLFTVPLMKALIDTPSILAYRFGFATIMVAIVMMIKKISFRESLRNLGVLMALAILYFLSAYLLIDNYKYIPSGMATVIHFLYPTMVALLMLLRYGQKLSIRGILSLALAFIGVVLLSGISGNLSIRWVHIGLVAASGFCYALYIVIINKSKINLIPQWRLTFYVMAFAAIIFVIYAELQGGLQVPTVPMHWVSLLLLGLLPTVISNILLIYAISKVGSTQTSIMGVMEPLTAVIIGVTVLGEVLSVVQTLGICVVLFAVYLLISDSRGKALK